VQSGPDKIKVESAPKIEVESAPTRQKWNLPPSTNKRDLPATKKKWTLPPKRREWNLSPTRQKRDLSPTRKKRNVPRQERCGISPPRKIKKLAVVGWRRLFCVTEGHGSGILEVRKFSKTSVYPKPM